MLVDTDKVQRPLQMRLIGLLSDINSLYCASGCLESEELVINDLLIVSCDVRHTIHGL